MTVERLTALVFWHKSVVKCCYVGLELEWSEVVSSGLTEISEITQQF